MNLNNKALIVSEDEYFYLINNNPNMFRVPSFDAGFKKKGWVGNSRVVRIMHLTKEGFFLGFDTRLNGIRAEMMTRAKGWVFDQLGLFYESGGGLIDLPYTCSRAVNEIKANNPDLEIKEVFNLNDNYTTSAGFSAGFMIGEYRYEVMLRQVYSRPDLDHVEPPDFEPPPPIRPVVMYRWGMAKGVLLLGIPLPELQKVSSVGGNNAKGKIT